MHIEEFLTFGVNSSCGDGGGGGACGSIGGSSGGDSGSAGDGSNF